MKDGLLPKRTVTENQTASIQTYMYGTSYRKQLSNDGHKGFKTENRPMHKKPASQVV